MRLIVGRDPESKKSMIVLIVEVSFILDLLVYSAFIASALSIAWWVIG
jgi:hypothetical protein